MFYKIQTPKEEIEQMYLGEGLSTFKIAKKIGCHPATLFNFMQRNGIKTRGQKESLPRGADSPHWKGGSYVSDGYVRIKQGSSDSYKMEHVIIAERVLGRPMRKGEVVHHIDGNRSNNTNSNLLICTQSFHSWLHRMQELAAGKPLFGRVA